MSDFLKIGHRGAKAYEPENTLRSFERALKLGANAIEFDVRSTEDGKIVVIHDAKLDRITNGCGYVNQWTLEKLKILDAGKGEKIPTLEEVFNGLKSCFKIFNIELKETNIQDAVLDTVRQHGLVDSVIVSAFARDENEPGNSSTWQDLFWMKTREKNLKIALLAEKLEFARAAILAARQNGEVARDNPFPIHALSFSKNIVDQELMRQVREATDCQLFVWTVNDADEIKRFKDMGVDGIFSDYPELL